MVCSLDPVRAHAQLIEMNSSLLHEMQQAEGLIGHRCVCVCLPHSDHQRNLHLSANKADVVHSQTQSAVVKGLNHLTLSFK